LYFINAFRFKIFKIVILVSSSVMKIHHTEQNFCSQLVDPRAIYAEFMIDEVAWGWVTFWELQFSPANYHAVSTRYGFYSHAT